MAEDRQERSPYPFPLPEDFLDGERDRDTVSPFSVLNPLVRHARLILIVPLLVALLVAAFVATRDNLFVADSRFLPARGDYSSRSDGGVLSQLNRLVGGGQTNSPDGMFYSFLVRSPAFLRPAAASEYAFERETEDGATEMVEGSLAEIQGMSAPDEDTDTRWSLGILRGMVSSWVDPGTGFVAVSVQAPWPGLAVAVNERLLELVNEFNVDQRQTQAAAERVFIETRMTAAQQELREAERELVRFLEQNQQYEQSPRLVYEVQRLEAEVELKRNLYRSLAQSYDQARINEVRNTPVVTVVQRPEDTVYLPNRDGVPLRYGLMAFIIGLLVMIAFVAIWNYFSRQTEEHPDEYDEFRRLALNTVPGPLRDRLGGRRDRDDGGTPAVATGAGSDESKGTW